jgi:XTP/dITP diphosphohydrolase
VIGACALATANPDKAREICEVLAELRGEQLAARPVETAGATVCFVVSDRDRIDDALRDLPELDAAPDVEETGRTLEENARIKAVGVSDALSLLAIADDTGLEVDVLGGAPGVRAARYAGERATYADNVAKLLVELGDTPVEQRTARFATVALARWPDGREVVARGEVEGSIAREPRGTSGFGYDPVFVPAEGDGRTFAEMSATEKHRLSHRGRAFRALAARLVREAAL